jgi:hypothetical protein
MDKWALIKIMKEEDTHMKSIWLLKIKLLRNTSSIKM